MRIAISQSNYLPWPGYFKLISCVDKFLFYDSALYTKNDWRNRNRIIVGGKVKWISIPINYSFSAKLKINEVKLPPSDWKEEHLNIIYESYKNTARFNSLFPTLKSQFESNHEFLSDLNFSLTKYVCGILKIETKLITNPQPSHKLGQSERLVELCKSLGAETYVTTEKALVYLNVDLFKRENIDVEIMNFDSCLKYYKQPLQKFDPYISSLDLLFREGENEFLKRLSD